MDISMVDCLFHMHEANLQVNQITDGAYVPDRVGSHHQLLCPCGVFKSPGGHIALLIVQLQWPNMCRAMDRPDLEADPRFALANDRAANQAELIPVIEAWLASFPNDVEALKRLDEFRVPSGPVLNPADAIHHPYFLERGMVRAVEDPILGSLMLPEFFRSDFQAKVIIRRVQPPLLGEHNRAILGDVLGYDDGRIDTLVETGVLNSSDR